MQGLVSDHPSKTGEDQGRTGVGGVGVFHEKKWRSIAQKYGRIMWTYDIGVSMSILI